MRAAEGHRLTVNCDRVPEVRPTFEAVARRYMAERMPSRYTTSLGYRNNLEKHAIPKWGSMYLLDIKPIAVDRWFQVLSLSAKTKAHIRSVMRQVFEYAMLCEFYDVQRNPMDLIKIEGLDQARPQAHHSFARRFSPYVAVHPCGALQNDGNRCALLGSSPLGTDRAQVVGLRLGNNTVMIQRSMVDTRTGEVKTEYSEKPLPLDRALVELLRRWQEQTEFKAESDWVWASPYQAGTLPYYPNWIQREYLTQSWHSCWSGTKNRLAHPAAHVPGLA